MDSLGRPVCGSVRSTISLRRGESCAWNSHAVCFAAEAASAVVIKQAGRKSCGPRGLSMIHHRIQPTIAALGIAALVFVCLSAFCYRTGRAVDTESRFFDPGRAPDVDEALCACKIEYALHSREANDVVFIGDSSGCDGVDPIAFERASGHRAYNLCSEARLGPVGYLATLEAYLLNHPRPMCVVLCVTPITFEWPLGFMGADIANHFVAHYGHEVGMFSARQDVAYFAQCGAASWLSARRADDVRDLPLSSLGTETYRSLQR
jgi:hypothetical protein